MKFNIQSKLLLAHLSAVSKVVNSKNKLSILDNFLFSLSGDRLQITGSDQETTLVTTVQVQDAEGEGKFAANVKTLLELIKQLPDLALSVEVDPNSLEIVITYLNGRYSFVGVDGNQYPMKADWEGETRTFTMPAKKLVSGIQHTLFAAGTDDMRPVMMGVYFDIKVNEVVFVATDTHKLVRFVEQGISNDFESSFILPSKPAAILSSTFEKLDADVTVTFDEKRAVFETEEYTLSCRFVNGRFPNYSAVIPTTSVVTLLVDRMSLLGALRRVSVFTSSSGLLKLDLMPGFVEMSTQDIDYSSSAVERIACDYQDAPLSIGFNDEHIIDVLNNIDADEVEIRLIDSSKAGLFLPGEQKENEDLLILLMPMML